MIQGNANKSYFHIDSIVHIFCTVFLHWFSMAEKEESDRVIVGSFAWNQSPLHPMACLLHVVGCPRLPFCVARLSNWAWGTDPESTMGQKENRCTANVPIHPVRPTQVDS